MVACAAYYYPTLKVSAERGQLYWQEFAFWPVALVVGAGASFGALLALTVGDHPLPLAVEHASIGALAGVSLHIFIALACPILICHSAPVGETAACGVYKGWVFTPRALTIGGIIGVLAGYLNSMNRKKQPSVHLLKKPVP